MLTTPIPTPLPGPSPRIRSWRVSRASHKAPRPPKPHNLCHEPLLQDTRYGLNGSSLLACARRGPYTGTPPGSSRYLRMVLRSQPVNWLIAWMLIPCRCSSLISSTSLPLNKRSEEHTSELQSPCNLVCRLLLEKKKK